MVRWAAPDPGDRIDTHATPNGTAVNIPTRGLITVSWSEIDTARQCALKHDLSYIERWTKPPRADGALARGTLWHLVLEHFYRALQATQGPKPGAKPLEPEAVRLKQAVAAGAKVLQDALSDAGNNQAAIDTVELVSWMFDGYVAQWGVPDWWIAAAEHAAVVRLPNLLGTPSRFALKLKIDLVIQIQSALMGKQDRAKRWVVDFKSGKDLPKDKDFDFMDQFSLYTWALHRMGKDVFGQMYDAARTQRNKTPGQTLESRFSRTPMYRTETELAHVATEAYQTVSARYRQQIECDRAGVEPPRTTDPERCGWRCDFTEPCLHGRRGGDMRDFLEATGFEQRFERH